MSFNSILERLKSIEGGMPSCSKTETMSCEDCLESNSEVDCAECGNSEMSNHENGEIKISISGSNDSIKDLMRALANLEDETDQDMIDTEFGGLSITPVEELNDEYANTPGTRKFDIDAVTPTGNDMHSNLGDHRQRKFDMPVARPNEHLVSKLKEQYSKIKNR